MAVEWGPVQPFGLQGQAGGPSLAVSLVALADCAPRGPALLHGPPLAPSGAVYYTPARARTRRRRRRSRASVRPQADGHTSTWMRAPKGSETRRACISRRSRPILNRSCVCVCVCVPGRSHVQRRTSNPPLCPPSAPSSTRHGARKGAAQQAHGADARPITPPLTHARLLRIAGPRCKLAKCRRGPAAPAA
jgi:hypothetical protein